MSKLTRVNWNDEEWEQCATILHRDNPERDYLHCKTLSMVTKRELCKAAEKVVPPRRFLQPSRDRERLLAAYTRLRSKMAATPADGPRRAPPPSAPPSPLKLDEQQRPAAIAAPAEPKPTADPFAAVAWTAAEWLAIATEIDRMHPGSNYAGREHLAGLTSEDVAIAQRVLPVERHIRHVKVATFSSLLPALKTAFGQLREQRRQAAEAARAVQAVPVAAPAAQPVAVAPVAPAGSLEAAIAPLLDYVLARLAQHLRPMIDAAVEQAINGPATTATAAPATSAPARVDVPAAPAARPGKAPRLRIGIVGNRTTYADDLAREFPTVEFRCIDQPREVESVRNCDRVLVLTKFVSHSFDHAVKRAVGRDVYMPVHGSLSDIRRVLTGILNSVPARQTAQVH